MTAAAESPLATALAAVGLPTALAARLALDGGPGTSTPRLSAEEVGTACIGAALLAAARLGEARTGEWSTPALDRGEVRAALVSERLFRIDGEPAGAGFAPASRFWRAADGWVRTHANYPWHREALLRAVGAVDDDALVDAIAERGAEEIEAAAFAAGGVAAKVRTAADWREHPQAAAVAAEPLVAHADIGQGEPRKPTPGAQAPAAGVRVLDLTRVIAGPVCSRYLAALGADVLRLDPPDLPDFKVGQSGDTLLGKRSAFLDLSTEAGARRLEGLLADADVVLLGYRPGALARYGLVPEELAARHPGVVVMELAAWGHTGPWHERRGFDSIVQAASGIAAVEAGPDGDPGALPCQLLDHGTGYLAAAAVLGALAEQREGGGSYSVRLSLARTARWLLDLGERDAGARRRRDEDSASDHSAGRPLRREGGVAFAAPVDGDFSLAAVPPPGSFGGTPLRWRGPAARYGGADPEWSGPR